LLHNAFAEASSYHHIDTLVLPGDIFVSKVKFFAKLKVVCKDDHFVISVANNFESS